MKTLTFIVADHNPVDKFLHAKIVCELGHHVLHVVEDGGMLIRACRDLKPDIILFDTAMPKKDGITACTIIRQEFPAIQCICATSVADLSFPVTLKNNGIDGYLLKGFTATKLNTALQSVLSNQFYIDPLLYHNMVNSIHPIPNQLSGLPELPSHHLVVHHGEKLKITDRQVLLVSAMYENMKREEIAQLMNISTDSIDMNIKRLKNKMGVESRIALVKLFSEWGLIQPIAHKKG